MTDSFQPSARRLLAVLAVVEAGGLAAMLGGMLAYAHANGGRIWFDISLFGERYLEYWLFVASIPVLTLGLYYALEYVLWAPTE